MKTRGPFLSPSTAPSNIAMTDVLPVQEYRIFGGAQSGWGETLMSV